MKNIVHITVALVISCLVAGVVMGLTFTVTAKAKKHNEHQNVKDTMIALLGYGKANPAPSDLQLHPVYRYIIADGQTQYLGYMVPVRKGAEEAYDLVVLSLQGKFVEEQGLAISPEAAIEPPDREKALRAVLKPPKTFVYADQMVVAKLGDKRLAYLLPGEFPGFKTFISVMLALDPSFRILGLEIMESEEDPGLGGEIKQEYFKHQFTDKKLEKVRKLKVVKEPLPDEYKKYLETRKWKKGMFSKEQIENIRQKYEDSDIYAITGATISSRSVTNGVKGVVKKFAYRANRLDKVIASQHIPVAF